MTKLQLALKRFTERAQFHNQPLLDTIIQAAREEEHERLIAPKETVYCRCPQCGIRLAVDIRNDQPPALET